MISSIEPARSASETWTPRTRTGTTVPRERTPRTTPFAGQKDLPDEGISDEDEQRDPKDHEKGREELVGCGPPVSQHPVVNDNPKDPRFRSAVQEDGSSV